MTSILNQLKAWRSRWQPPKLDEDTDKLLNRAFASTFSHNDGKVVLDYLIDKYLKPLEFIGPVDPYKLAGRNDQQVMLVDILTRLDMGLHPMAFEPEHSSDDEKEVDVRQ